MNWLILGTSFCESVFLARVNPLVSGSSYSFVSDLSAKNAMVDTVCNSSIDHLAKRYYVNNSTLCVK